jgi:hypothetical protein
MEPGDDALENLYRIGDVMDPMSVVWSADPGNHSGIHSIDHRSQPDVTSLEGWLPHQPY